MNCLLLLIILFCRGGNSIRCNGCGDPCNGKGHGGCNRPGGPNFRPGCNEGCGLNQRPGCNDSCSSNHRSGFEARNEPREERQTTRKDCECDFVNSISSSTTARGTQFPYLEVEPRTCGCEEKNN